jgi:putative transcriptional regulator
MNKKMKGRAGKYRSRLSAAIHDTAAGLHRIGLMDKATMREFDASCLTAVEPLSAKEIAAIRKRAGVSRASSRAISM